MRTHLIDNDITLFLNNSPEHFSNVIKKRNKTWRTALSDRGPFEQGFNFLDMILFQLADPSTTQEYSWSEIFEKLESLDFKFEPFHYFPNRDLFTNYHHAMALNYKELVTQLKNRDIPFEQNSFEEFIKNQKDSVEDSVADLLRTMSPIIDEILLSLKVDKAIKNLTQEAYEIHLINNPSKETKAEVTMMALILNTGVSFGGESIEDSIKKYQLEQSEKVKFILNYLDTQNISVERAVEMLYLFKPCGAIMIDFDRSNRNNNSLNSYFEAVRNGHPLPRKYFTTLQLELIDIIESKFNIKVFDN